MLPCDVMQDEATLADALWRARALGGAVDVWPGDFPRDRAEAYRVQSAVTQASGQPVAGWKIGAVSDQAQAMLGLDCPFAGPIPAKCVHTSGDALDTPGTALLLETEIVLRLADDIRPDMPSTDIAAAIGSVAPSFEVVNRRITGAPDGQGLTFIADGGVHGATVLGADVPVAAYDPDAPVLLRLPDGTEIPAAPAAAHGWPDLTTPLAWLAKELDGIGQHLVQGQIVMIGTITPPLPMTDAGVYRAEIAGLGGVNVGLRR